MSYRTYINGTQIFGNNDYYPEWIDYIQSKGIVVDAECGYDDTLTDFMEALSVIEQIVIRKVKERDAKCASTSRIPYKPLFDLTWVYENFEKERIHDAENNLDDPYQNSLFDNIVECIDHAYAFLPYQFYLACKDCLELTHPFSTPKHFRCYKLKEGAVISISAH